MAIVNVTPDSFSDGGRWLAPDGQLDATALVAGVAALLDQGAQLVDVGGESTRPGATTVPVADEIARVVPAIAAIHQAYPTLPISVDTRKAAVAEAALATGASIINDVSGLQFDPGLLRVAVRQQAMLVITHSQGGPETMQDNPQYDDVVGEVRHFLKAQALKAEAAGLPRSHIIIDPGFGFGKTRQHNLQLLAGLGAFTSLPWPVLVGLSRKSFLSLGQDLDMPTRDALSRLAEALASTHGVRYLRVHRPYGLA